MFSDEPNETPWAGNRPVNGRRPREVNGSDNSAMALKDAYVTARRLFEMRRAGEPVSYNPSPRWDGEDAFEDNPEISPRASTWERVATKLSRLDVDPVDLVRRLFDDLEPGARPILPNQLAASSTLSRYEKLVASAAPNVALALKSQTEVFLTAFCCSDLLDSGDAKGSKRVDAWVGVLLDESLSLSALFRYCLALDFTSHGYDDHGPSRFQRVADHYEAPANEQYRRNKDAYDEAWEKILPSSLRNGSCRA